LRIFTETENPPYFYFRCSSPTELESASHVSSLVMKVFTKFEDDMLWPSVAYLYSIIAADTLRDLWSFDLWHFDLGQWSPMRRGKFLLHIWNHWPRFDFPLHNYGATM